MRYRSYSIYGVTHDGVEKCVETVISAAEGICSPAGAS